MDNALQLHSIGQNPEQAPLLTPPELNAPKAQGRCRPQAQKDTPDATAADAPDAQRMKKSEAAEPVR
jgi:hypothetical protein